MADEGIPFHFDPTSRTPLSPTRPFSLALSPLDPLDPFTPTWFGNPLQPGSTSSSLEARFLRLVGNARLPSVAVCGTMQRMSDESGIGAAASASSSASSAYSASSALHDGAAYVYVLALREPVDERDPAWINLCLDLEDEAALVTRARVEVVQTVGWIDELL